MLLADFISALQSRGYQVDDLYPDVYRVQGRGIIAAFSTEYVVEDDNTFARMFVADNAEAFNKWSQAALFMKVEDAMNNFDELLGHLEWLGTAKGAQYSQSLGWDNRVMVPRDV